MRLRALYARCIATIRGRRLQAGAVSGARPWPWVYLWHMYAAGRAAAHQPAASTYVDIRGDSPLTLVPVWSRIGLACPKLWGCLLCVVSSRVVSPAVSRRHPLYRHLSVQRSRQTSQCTCKSISRVLVCFIAVVCEVSCVESDSAPCESACHTFYHVILSSLSCRCVRRFN